MSGRGIPSGIPARPPPFFLPKRRSSNPTHSLSCHARMTIQSILRALSYALAARAVWLTLALAAAYTLGTYDESSYTQRVVPCLQRVLPSTTSNQQSSTRTQRTFVEIAVIDALRRLVVWDSVHYLRVARCGYEYEHQAAFMPLFPSTVAAVARSVVTNDESGGVDDEDDAAAIVLAGLVGNAALFCLAAISLLRLARAVGLDDAQTRRAVLLFVVNPASPFFTAPLYTESAYAAAFFTASAAVAERRWLVAAASLALASSVRANGAASGALLVGVAYALDVLPWISKETTRSLGLLDHSNIRVGVATVARGFARTASLVVLTALPLIWNERAGVLRYCVGDDAPTWCAASLPLPYTHAQSAYWGVGPFRYWQLAQLPNFLLATPAWIASAAAASSCLRPSHRRAMLPHVAVLVFSTALSVVVMHVQVSTRFLCAGSPALYLGLAMLLPKHFRWVMRWAFVYTFVGTAAHYSFLPWT